MRQAPSPRLRVVQVSFHSDGRGRDGSSLLDAWPTLSAVAAAVARAGVEVAVVQAAHADETISRDGVDYHFVKDTSRQRSRVVDRARSVVPDVVHVHGFHHALAVRRLTTVLREAPVLVQDRGGLPQHGFRRLAWKLAFESIAGVTFTSSEQMVPWAACGVLRPNVQVFPVLGGSSSFTPGDQAEARQITGMFGNPCLLWTGRLDENKDPLMMLDAVERAAAQLPSLRLWCCFGNAPLLGAVTSRIESSALLRDRTVLLGARPRAEMEMYHRAADFYLQSSHGEVSGFSLLEALACGTTPLVTDIPASRRIVGDAGSLTPVGDAQALAGAILDWSTRNPAALRRAARARFESALTFDVIGRELRTAYETLADR